MKEEGREKNGGWKVNFILCREREGRGEKKGRGGGGGGNRCLKEIGRNGE